MSSSNFNLDPLQSNLDQGSQTMNELLSTVSDLKTKQKNTNIALTIGDTANQLYSGAVNTNGAFFPPSAGTVKGFVFLPKVQNLGVGQPQTSFLAQVGVNWQATGFFGGSAPAGNPSVPVWFGFGEINPNTFYDGTTGTVPFFRQWFQVNVGNLLIKSSDSTVKFTPFFGSYNLLNTITFRNLDGSGNPQFSQDATDQKLTIGQLSTIYTQGQTIAFGVSVDTSSLSGAQELALVTMLSSGFEWLVSLNFIYNSILSISNNITT